jgi:hypothetical protein
MPGSTLGVNLELPAGDPLADTALKMGVNLFAKAQRGDGRMKDAFLDAEVPKSPYCHVSAYA